MSSLTEEVRFVEENETDGFWVICSDDSKVALYSRAATEFGIKADADASSLIGSSDRLEFEDVMHMIRSGGNVSVVLSANTKTGYSAAHIKNIRLFSGCAAEIKMYRDKNEYLAVSRKNGERLNRVFRHMGGFIEEVKGFIKFTADAENTSDTMRYRQREMFAHTEKIERDNDFYRLQCAHPGTDDSSLLDASALFDIISKRLVPGSGNPFESNFRNEAHETAVMCRCDMKRFAGIVLLAAAVAARLSDYRKCSVTLMADGDSVMIEASCRMHKDNYLYGRSCEFEEVYRCLCSDPMELMALEHLTSIPEWSMEYSATEDGMFSLRASLVREMDSDRLKFRDSLEGSRSAVDEYLDYLNRSFSSYPEEQCQDK